jgi:hypothetical protein
MRPIPAIRRTAPPLAALPWLPLLLMPRLLKPLLLMPLMLVAADHRPEAPAVLRPKR